MFCGTGGTGDGERCANAGKMNETFFFSEDACFSFAALSALLEDLSDASASVLSVAFAFPFPLSDCPGVLFRIGLDETGAEVDR